MFVLMVFLFGCVHGERFEDRKSQLRIVPPSKARIFFYERGSVLKRPFQRIPTKTYIEEKFICNIRAGVFCFIDIDPGEHVAKSIHPDETIGTMSFKVYPGEIKFIRSDLIWDPFDSKFSENVFMTSENVAKKEMAGTIEYQLPDAEEKELADFLRKDHPPIGAFVSYGGIYPVGAGGGLDFSSRDKSMSLELGATVVRQSWGAMLWYVSRTPTTIYSIFGFGLGWVQFHGGDINMKPYLEDGQGVAARVRIGLGWQVTRDFYMEAGFKLYPLFPWKGPFAQAGYRF